MGNAVTQILIVDDDAVTRLMVNHILTSQGHTVSEAESASEALERFAAEGCDLVICDYHMPGGSGLDVVDFFVEQSVPFVLLTGVAEHHELDDDRADLVSAYITKPVSSQDLAVVVARVMNAAADQTAATAVPPAGR